jgi:hypothetical protein
MQLLILWCEAQAAQRRVRDTFRDSRKLNEELTSSPQSNEGTLGPVHCLSAKRVVLPTVRKKYQIFNARKTIDENKKLLLNLITIFA